MLASFLSDLVAESHGKSSSHTSPVSFVSPPLPSMVCLSGDALSVSATRLGVRSVPGKDHCSQAIPCFFPPSIWGGRWSEAVTS